MIKYEKEYKQTENKEEFITLVLSIYKDIKPDTARRRFYDLRKRFGVQQPMKKYEEIKQETESVVLDEEKLPLKIPGHMKLLMFDDMKKMGYKLTKEFLRQYGFTVPEINWLRINKKV